jgi:hypothetical protein
MDEEKKVRVCRTCNTPKDINSYRPGEWNASYNPRCISCVKKAELARKNKRTTKGLVR